jgi:hypothetical protein
MTRLSIAAFVLCVAGCAAEKRASDPHAVADVKQVMSIMLEPAAETYWDAVGSVIDSTGTQEFAPNTPGEWEDVWRAALVVAESGNLLMLEGRARDRDQWMRLAQAMVDAGSHAASAALTRDPVKVFDAGGELYEACTACHAAYARETLRPSHGPDTASKP